MTFLAKPFFFSFCGISRELYGEMVWDVMKHLQGSNQTHQLLLATSATHRWFKLSKIFIQTAKTVYHCGHSHRPSNSFSDNASASFNQPMISDSSDLVNNADSFLCKSVIVIPG